jgi:preprotein translocase subunit YajC
MFWSTAFAQTAAAPGASQPSMMEILFPFAAMMFIFYFLYARPQAKRQKEQQKFVESLKKGDQVITNGGIYGEITGTNEKFVTLQVDTNTRIKVLRSQILGSVKEANP